MTQATNKPRDVLRDIASARVTWLQTRYLANVADAVATLARLRRCDPAAVGAEPLVWQVTLGDLPSELTQAASDLPTPSERALHATLVLYALHQQSEDQPVHRVGARFGSAVGKLARARAVDEELDSATAGRLRHAALAADFEGHLHHLRGLIQLMRSESPAIGIDYGLLAVDLAQLADPRRDSSSVLLRWGRGLHERPTNDTQSTTSEETK